MTVAAARTLRDSDICFVGIGMPSAACNLARLSHAPGITLIYESGTIATKPDVLPLSIGYSPGGFCGGDGNLHGRLISSVMAVNSGHPAGLAARADKSTRGYQQRQLAPRCFPFYDRDLIQQWEATT